MKNNSNNKFQEGDIIEIRGFKHKVEKVDYSPVEEKVIQYRIEAIDEDAPPSTLKPYANEKFVVKEHHDCNPEKVGEAEE